MSFLEMSITGGVMILVAAVLRLVLLNKLPKKAFVLLWELAMLRLILPISVPSVFSIYTLFNQIGTDETVDIAREPFTNAPAGENFQSITVPVVTVPAENNTFSTSSLPLWTIVWIAGATISLVIFIVGYVIVFRKYRYSVLVKSGYPIEWLLNQKNRREVKICLSSETSTPLTYGIFRPTILLPENIDTEKSERLTYILTHEMIHIKRFDMIRKMAAALVLSIHWFNPFVWVMYTLYNRDIELACDEAVVCKMNSDCRSAYAMALIGMEEERRKFSLFSHFSKNAAEERIVTIMKTKKITLCTGIITVALICGVPTIFATSASYADTEDSPVYSPSNSLDDDDYELLALQFKEDYNSLISSESNESSKVFTNDEQTPINIDTIDIQSSTLFAEQEVIDEIAAEIANEDINSWIEVNDATLNFDYTLPIYITLNMNQNSNMILETLAFDNQYLIPAMSDSTCIGAFTIIKFENKWTISSYINGFNIVQFIQSKKFNNAYLINIPQLKGEYGLLEISDVEEKYTPAPGFITSDTKNGKQLLKEIMKH